MHSPEIGDWRLAIGDWRLAMAMARWLIADIDASISYFDSLLIGGELCVHTFEMLEMITQ